MALEGGEGSAHTLAALYPWERPSTQCTGGWVGPRADLDRCGKSRPPPGFDPRTVQPVASHYTDWATRPTIWSVGWPKTMANNCHTVCQTTVEDRTQTTNVHNLKSHNHILRFWDEGWEVRVGVGKHFFSSWTSWTVWLTMPDPSNLIQENIP